MRRPVGGSSCNNAGPLYVTYHVPASAAVLRARGQADARSTQVDLRVTWV